MKIKTVMAIEKSSSLHHYAVECFIFHTPHSNTHVICETQTHHKL